MIKGTFVAECDFCGKEIACIPCLREFSVGQLLDKSSHLSWNIYSSLPDGWTFFGERLRCIDCEHFKLKEEV
jgi:hypothetical protein